MATTDASETSPFSPLLNTNYVPSDVEKGVIRHLVEDREAAVAVLAVEVESAKRALAGLEERHAVHSKSIEDHTALLSPMRSIPFELLALMFLACRDSVQTQSAIGYNRQNTSNRHISVVISHVCADWRRVALHTPNLWSEIHIAIPELYAPLNRDSSTHYASWCMRMSALHTSVKTWIHRALSSSITLRLASGTMGPNVESGYRVNGMKVYGAFVDMLWESCSRWRDVQCTIWPDPMTSYLTKLFNGAQTDYPLLRKICLCVVEDDPLDEVVVSIARKLTRSNLFAAPSLRDITLKGVWGDIPAAKFNGSSSVFDSVTCLTFEGTIGDEHHFGGPQAIALLGAFPNLISVDIVLTDRQYYTMLATPPISLPHLAAMTLHYMPAPKGFASCLHLPRLTSLRLDCNQPLSPQYEAINGNAELILAYGCQLNELTLSYESIPPTTLPSCLKQLSSLISLDIARKLTMYPCFDSDLPLLSELCQPGVLPQLERLRLRNISNAQADGSTERAVVQLLTRRLHSSTPQEASSRGELGAALCLRKAEIQFLCRQKVDVWKEMRSRGVMKGFDLSLDYPAPLCDSYTSPTL